MRPCRLITHARTSGVSGAGQVGYDSWDAAVEAYTRAYNADSVQILRGPGLRSGSRRARRRRGTPQPSTPAAPYATNANTMTPRAPVPYNPPSAAFADRGNPEGTPCPTGYPPYMGYSPGPMSPTPHSQVPGSSPGPLPLAIRPREEVNAKRLRIIEEALAEQDAPTPSPSPAPVHQAHDENHVLSRLATIEEALNEHALLRGIATSSRSPTADNCTFGERLDALNATIDMRLTALEAAINYLVTQEAARESRRANHCGSQNLDRHPDPTPQPAPPSAAPVAGPSTGPGTIAGEAARPCDAANNPPRPYTVICIDSDSEDEFEYDDYGPEGDVQVAQLLAAIHENYKANRKTS